MLPPPDFAVAKRWPYSYSLWPAGGVKADPDDWEEREAVRHGASVLKNSLLTDAKRALLHTEGRAADVVT